MINLLAITIETCVRRLSATIAFFNLRMTMLTMLIQGVFTSMFFTECVDQTPQVMNVLHLLLALVESEAKFGKLVSVFVCVHLSISV